MEHIHISLAPEIIYKIGNLSITNALFLTLITSFLLLTIAISLKRNISLIPSKIQLSAELLIGGVYDYVEGVLESKELARKFFPLILSIFIFVLFLNWIQFVPGVGSLGFWKGENHEGFIPLLRGGTTDLNLTLALALIAFIAIEVAGITALGIKNYFHKFFNFSSPINFAVGIIDLFSELARLISFSFRLFGNIFAGEVIIVVILFFVPYLVPVPFIGFEIFVGFIQAAIFSLLTLFFIKIATTAHH